jgi:hypothetical protein
MQAYTQSLTHSLTSHGLTHTHTRTAGAERLAAARAHHAERLRQAKVRHPCVDLTSYVDPHGHRHRLSRAHTTLQSQSLPTLLFIVFGKGKAKEEKALRLLQYRILFLLDI